jgi:hypothetical protein
MGRKEDLEENIRASYELIRKYDEKIRLAGDPKEQARHTLDRDEQWQLIRGWLDEYVSLCRRLRLSIPRDIQEFAAHFPEYADLTLPDPRFEPRSPSVEVEIEGPRRGDPWTVRVRNWYLSLPTVLQVVMVTVLIGLPSAAVILGLSQFFPFRTAEATPIIQQFLVHHADGSTETFAAGDLVEIAAYTQVLVEAVVSDQADVSCTWSVVRGTKLPAEGCATLYSSPLEGNRDALSVLAQSPRKTLQVFAGVHIKVVQVQR